MCSRFCLAAQNAPVGTRVTVFRAVVGAAALRGSEVWGTIQKRCGPAQAPVSKAARVTVQRNETGKGAGTAAVWRELGVPPALAEAPCCSQESESAGKNTLA